MSLPLAAAQSGDKDAIREILEHFYSSVATLCQRICSDSTSSEDATQEALISISTGLATFRNDSQLSTWIYRIAYNAAIDEVRRFKRRPVPTELSTEGYGQTTPDEMSSRTAPDDAIGTAELRMDINWALSQLDAEFRNVFLLREVSQLDYQSIAEITGVPVGTVRSRIARSRQKMIEILEAGNFLEGFNVKVERDD